MFAKDREQGIQTSSEWGYHNIKISSFFYGIPLKKPDTYDKLLSNFDHGALPLIQLRRLCNKYNQFKFKFKSALEVAVFTFTPLLQPLD